MHGQRMRLEADQHEVLLLQRRGIVRRLRHGALPLIGAAGEVQAVLPDGLQMRAARDDGQLHLSGMRQACPDMSADGAGPVDADSGLSI